jgi:hypothetical protein
MFSLIPLIRRDDSVFSRNKDGAASAVLIIDALHQTSCVLVIPLPELMEQQASS